MTDLDKERAAFEAWWGACPDRRDPSPFPRGYAWTAWQARAALAGPEGRVKVPTGQTPLDEKLGHPFIDVIKEGEAARDAGTGSPYHGHSLEHVLHSVGWVQRDLRLALDAARAAGREMPPAGGNAAPAPEGKEPVAWRWAYLGDPLWSFGGDAPATTGKLAALEPLYAAPSPEPAQREVQPAAKRRGAAYAALTRCYECGAVIEESDAQWTEDGSPFCKRHKLNAGPSPAPGAERVIGEAEAVVGYRIFGAEPSRRFVSGDRLTVFERNGKLYVQFSDEREG